MPKRRRFSYFHGCPRFPVIQGGEDSTPCLYPDSPHDSGDHGCLNVFAHAHIQQAPRSVCASAHKLLRASRRVGVRPPPAQPMLSCSGVWPLNFNLNIWISSTITGTLWFLLLFLYLSARLFDTQRPQFPYGGAPSQYNLKSFPSSVVNRTIPPPLLLLFIRRYAAVPFPSPLPWSILRCPVYATGSPGCLLHNSLSSMWVA